VAYFTEPMGDEFKKAIEEALKEMKSEEASGNENKPKKARKVRKKKDPAHHLSASTKKSLK
jgi:hypothetical protein